MKQLVRPASLGCLSDLSFDRWQADELAPDEVRKAEQHLSSCQHCRERRAVLRAEAEQFLARFPDPPLAQARVAPLESPKPRGLRRLAPGALGLAAALLLWVGLGREHDDPGTRSKGSAHVGFFLKRGEIVLEGRDGQRVMPRDRLRFVITTSQPAQVAILGRDSTGAAFLYYPAGESSASVKAGRDVPLDSSVELDETLGEESIWAVFCEQPFELPPLQKLLAERGGLPALPGCSVDTLRLVKERQQ
jgi:hypothetical protein